MLCKVSTFDLCEFGPGWHWSSNVYIYVDQFSLGMMCTLKCESLTKYLGNLSKQSNMKIPVSGYAVQNWYISTTPQVETNELNMISFLLWYHSNIFFLLPENFLTLFLMAIFKKLNRKLHWYILFAFCVSVFFYALSFIRWKWRKFTLLRIHLYL